ncbi:MAG: acyl-CoA dehydrogenase family protein [Halanaerobiales bacterium]|nr:acyl-CoA dehydrogenase family protein [Halanaerobiales bacterium]
MKISLSEKGQKIIDEIRIFTDEEIRPNAKGFDENQALPQDLIDKLAAKGYLGATIPAKYGGLELDPITYGLFTEEIGKVCSNTRGLLTVHDSLVGESILKWGTEEQKDKWLPLMVKGKKIGAFALTEPEVGTDAKSVQTSYRKEGNNYVITGKKKWISFGDIADFFLVIASNDEKVTAFLVERERGVKTTPIKGLLGGRGSHIAEVEFDEIVVPEENILGKEGTGFTYVVSAALDHGRYSIAWAGVAIAQGALEAMINYSRERSQFGKKIRSFQLIQKMIADAVTDIYAARSFCLRAGELRKSGDYNAITETTMAKYFASKVAMGVTTNAVQVHGGNGCYNEYPVERFFREAKILEIIEGTSQVLQQIIANYCSKKYRHRG